MKTKVNGYNVDLSQVTIIGPLKTSPHNNALGCTMQIRGANEPLWLQLAEDKIDPYQLDDAKNALARATANANYDVLVQQWKAVD